MKLTIRLAMALVVLFIAWPIAAQQETASANEPRVALTEAAVAHDADGAPVLQATLRTQSLNGAHDDPVTNVRLIIKNTSTISYAFVSGLVTFYDASGVRCGEGIFKADVLAADESFDTDTPGLRIRCQASTWRIVATHLLPRMPPNPSGTVIARNFIIEIDGQSHPIQLDRPLVLSLGERRRTIIVRTVR